MTMAINDRSLALMLLIEPCGCVCAATPSLGMLLCSVSEATCNALAQAASEESNEGCASDVAATAAVLASDVDCAADADVTCAHGRNTSNCCRAVAVCGGAVRRG